MKLILLIVTFISINVHAGKVSTEKRPMPDFTLKSNKGSNIRLSDFRGQVVMLNFWASWCGPCRQEMPELDKIYQRYSSAGFTVLGVNNDKSEKLAEEYLVEYPVSFPIIYDHEKEVRDVFKTNGIPYSVFIDCDGMIVQEYESYKKGDEKIYLAKAKELVRACDI